MKLEDFYRISLTKKDKTITDLLVIEVYELINKKKGSDKNDNSK